MNTPVIQKEERPLLFAAIIAACVALVVLVALIRSSSDNDVLEVTTKRAIERAKLLELERDSLLGAVEQRNKEAEEQRQLSLKLFGQMDSINESYNRFTPRLGGATRTELRAMADSILAGFARSRGRYLVLLNSRSPADDRRDSLGTGGL